MTSHLRHVDGQQQPGWARRAYSRIGGTAAAHVVSRHVNWKLDPFLLRVSGGRLSSTLMVRSALLETQGARTGAGRRNAVIYFHDGERIIVVPSNAGAPRHPAWFHNLRAHPAAAIGGLPVTAEVIDDPAELARLWPVADSVFPTFRRYRDDAARTNRTIPLVALTPT